MLLITDEWLRFLPWSLTETPGFVTGAACVYLAVRQNIWNFPLGIANNLFFLGLFARARLFGDAGLQLVYLTLGVQGWYKWLYGGPQHSALSVSRASGRTLLLTGLFVLSGTAALTLLLRAVNGSAPLPDAFTTVLSLAAQYLLNRKLIENWLLWIVAGIIYIRLYLARGLSLTAVLYLIFLGLCVAGWLNWRRTLKAEPEVEQAETLSL